MRRLTALLGGACWIAALEWEGAALYVSIGLGLAGLGLLLLAAATVRNSEVRW